MPNESLPRRSFDKAGETELSLTEDQIAQIEREFGERVESLTVSKHEVDPGDGKLIVLEVNNVVFMRTGAVGYVVN